jgi:hypothetical protein
MCQLGDRTTNVVRDDSALDWGGLWSGKKSWRGKIAILSFELVSGAHLGMEELDSQG